MKARQLILLCIFALAYCTPLHATKVDSLLNVLDKAIHNRTVYLAAKIHRIDSIKGLLKSHPAAMERYEIQNQLIFEYQTLNCDSSLAYIDGNIAIAKQLNDRMLMTESQAKLAFVLSISGLFTQAWDVLKQIDYDGLPQHLKVLYHWSNIRYYENLIKYTDHDNYNREYESEIAKSRSSLMGLLDPNSDMYLKEKSFKLKAEGMFKESGDIQLHLFKKEKSDTHGYGMSAMGIAMIAKELGKAQLAEEYLVMAAITDVRLAIKENESLLTLAIYLNKKGDVNRAFAYIQAALDDANYYNSRFRNTVIARTQPIIEATYLAKIDQQRKNLRLYAIVISIFAIILILTLYFLFMQMKIVSRARKKLNMTNGQLILVNHKLDEANLVRERYIGYYLNQCAVYLEKLDDFRKNVYRKVKSRQLDDLQQLTSSNESLEKYAQDLYADFDRTFLEVYPNFVDEFNNLLRPDEQYQLKKDKLNTELRIFALIRLGISDVNQIAIFLRYSMQTIYNYKSKVKSKAIDDAQHFEEKVRKLGGVSTNQF
ncbi:MULTISPECIES: DUF6377 domain-containing protein [unclassified Sphingobacterium]|uniref:DUF6377 domain-containing protein n=1 Tax=unclassified Sphingobacterium TaxID=2609468 RepID=UPI0025E7A6AD|nr:MULTISPECIES: DUF6377 domain-containing protein [unclassified Sphingobacterium]